MARHKITSVDNLDGDNRIFIDVDGVEVVLLKEFGEVYALRNICPHQYGPVGEGKVERKITASVPEDGKRIVEKYEMDQHVIRCPCHAWAFDLDTGENIADSENAPGVATFNADVEDGDVYIEL